MRTQMHAFVRVRGEAFLVCESGDAERCSARRELREETGSKGFARALAVPTAAFRVWLTIFLLVGERSELEAVVQI